MIGRADPTGVGGDIGDAIRHRPTAPFDQEIMHANLFGIALRTPFPSSVLEIPNEFLLLRVDRDHRLLRRQRGRHALVDVDELRVPVGMIASLTGLAVALKAELLPLEQFAGDGAVDPVSACCQFRR